MDVPSTWVWVRSTVNLPGFPVGMYSYVDSEAEYVQECLDRQLLVEVSDGEE